VTATVSQLHPPRLCIDCVHFRAIEDERGLLGTECALFDEPIDDERIAADCGDYQP